MKKKKTKKKKTKKKKLQKGGINFSQILTAEKYFDMKAEFEKSRLYSNDEMNDIISFKIHILKMPENVNPVTLSTIGFHNFGIVDAAAQPAPYLTQILSNQEKSKLFSTNRINYYNDNGGGIGYQPPAVPAKFPDISFNNPYTNVYVMNSIRLKIPKNMDDVKSVINDPENEGLYYLIEISNGGINTSSILSGIGPRAVSRQKARRSALVKSLQLTPFLDGRNDLGALRENIYNQTKPTMRPE